MWTLYLVHCYSSFRFQVKKKVTSEELPLLLTSCTQSEVFLYSLLVTCFIFLL